MDLHLPDMTGIEASRRILVAAPTVIIIIFSADADRSLVDEALQAGACGYVLKTSVAVEFVHAIELVMAGKLYLSSEVSAGILEEYRKSLVGKSQMPKPLLSERETQLLRFIAKGRRNKEIAEELNLSANSIETYRARLKKKLSCSSTAELVHYAIRAGIAAP